MIISQKCMMPALICVLWSLKGCHAIQKLIEDNCDFEGMDIQNKMSAKDPENCWIECSSNADCTHFTWIPKAHHGRPHCFLKKGKMRDEVEKSKHNSKGNKCGLIASRLIALINQSGLLFKHDCDYSLNNIGYKKSLTIQQCVKECSIKSKCTHFTWTPTSLGKESTCYFKNGANVEFLGSVEERKGNECGLFAKKLQSLIVVVCSQLQEDFSNKTKDIFDEFFINITNDCQFGGYAFHDYNVKSVDQCLIACVNHGMCNHFTWFTKMSICALYYKDTLFDVERHLHMEKGRGDQCGFIGKFFEDQHVNNGYGVQNECSYNNSDIKKENAETADDCLDACLKDYLCTHFTWNAETQNTLATCSLKHDSMKNQIDNSMEKNPGSKCGFIPMRFKDIVDAYGIEIKDSCEFNEDLLNKFTDGSIDHCLNRCLQHGMCNHFTWNVGNRECYLHFSYPMHQVEKKSEFRFGFKCGFIKKLIEEIDFNYDKKIKDNCNYKGMNINNKGKFASWAGKCKTMCTEHPSCTHFT